MKNIGIAIIAEGMTDQIVIEKLVKTHYKDILSQDEITINYLQPNRDTTDEKKQSEHTHGGWQKVIEFLKQDEIIVDALSINKKIIIQIDGDIALNDVNLNIDAHGDCNIVCNQITEYLKSIISPEILPYIENNLIFAVPLHTTECWLIPIYTKDKKYCGKKMNCETNLIYATENMDCRKNYKNYTNLVKPIKKLRDLETIAHSSKSFEIFRESLPKITKNGEEIVVG